MAPTSSTTAAAQRKRQRHDAGNSSNNSSSSVPPAKSEQQVVSKKKKAPRRRPLRLVWRTRDSERSHLYNLELDVNNLRQEIHDLQQMRQLLFARALNQADSSDGSCVQLVRQYYKVLRHGYQETPVVIDGDNPVDINGFFRSVVDENVRLGQFSGLAQLIMLSQRYAQICSPLEMILQHAEVVPQDKTRGSSTEVVVIATFEYRGMLTMMGAENIFPALLSNPWLMDRLIGREVSGTAQAHLVVDTRLGQIVGYVFDLNFPAAFMRLLRSPGHVARVLEGSNVTPEYYIGDVSNIPHDTRAKTDPVAAIMPDNVKLPASPPQSSAWKMNIDTLLSSDTDGDE